MNYATPRIASIALLLGFATASTLAVAGLKDKPPEGVKLSGIEWQLDPYNSDDPGEAIDRAARKAQQASIEPRGSRGGVFDDDDPLGRHGSRDPIGGRNSTDPTGRPTFPSDSGSRWPSGDGRNSADIDPTGGGGNVSIQLGGGARSSFFMEALRTNPKTLTFSEGTRSVTVSEDGIDTECEAGSKEPFSDSYGDGVRSCGWSGRAWVVETKRGKQFSRTDRYELSKEGRTLRYTTTASEEGMGRVTIERRYQFPIHK